MDMIVRHAVVRGHQGVVDIVIEKDHIASVQPKAADEGRREIDAAGSLVLPGLFNLHFHADKCLLGEIMRPNLSGTLPEAIEITNDFKRKYDPAEVAERTLRVLETGVKNGTTFFRPVRMWHDRAPPPRRGLLPAREKFRRYCEIREAVAFPGRHRPRSGRWNALMS
jgi:cytosine deaminase